MSEYDNLKAQYDALRAKHQESLWPALSDLPTVDGSAFRASMSEVVPPVVITRYGQPRWVLLSVEDYADCAASEPKGRG